MGGFTRQLAALLQSTVHQAPLLQYIATDVNEDYAHLFETHIPQLQFKASLALYTDQGGGQGFP